MRSAACTLLVVLHFHCFASTCAAAADDFPTTFMQTWADAWESSDVDKMMTLYAPGKETIAIESMGHLRRGPAEIRKMYQGAFDELIFDRVTLTPIAQSQHDSIAWAAYRYKAEIRLKSDNAKYVIEVQGTFVLKKEDDSWKIAMEHFSTIPDIPRVRPAAN